MESGDGTSLFKKEQIIDYLKKKLKDIPIKKGLYYYIEYSGCTLSLNCLNLVLFDLGLSKNISNFDEFGFFEFEGASKSTLEFKVKEGQKI